jgi:hypothetical protein
VYLLGMSYFIKHRPKRFINLKGQVGEIRLRELYRAIKLMI